MSTERTIDTFVAENPQGARMHTGYLTVTDMRDFYEAIPEGRGIRQEALLEYLQQNSRPSWNKYQVQTAEFHLKEYGILRGKGFSSLWIQRLG